MSTFLDNKEQKILKIFIDTDEIYKKKLISKLKESSHFSSEIIDENRDPDLIILECYDTISSFKKIGEITNQGNLPILAVSDNKELLFIKKLIKAGINGYIHKDDPEINEAIQHVYRFGVYFHNDFWKFIIDDLKTLLKKE